MLGSHANLGGVIGRVISDSRTALKRVQVSSVFRLSKAITKHSKYGLTVLVLPSCLVKTDLTIHLDIPRNPGPKRAGNAAVEEVAAQFESIFLQQMLKSMRDATVKSDLFGSSQMETYESMADQQLALRLSEQGGIGLARMMVEQMQIRGHIDKAVKEGPSLEPTEVMKREND